MGDDILDHILLLNVRCSSQVLPKQCSLSYIKRKLDIIGLSATKEGDMGRFAKFIDIIISLLSLHRVCADVSSVVKTNTNKSSK